MKRNFALCLIVALLSTAHNAPAPITEESPTPAATAKPRPRPRPNPTPQATVIPKPTPLSWAGRWQIRLRGGIYEMQLSQTGDHVSGTYSRHGGVVDGTVSGNILSGTYTTTQYHGVFRLSLSSDGRSFSGSWDSSWGVHGPWTGQRQ